MHKEAIIEKLESVHNDLSLWLEKHDEEKWTIGPEGKWTTGQHVMHLLQSIKMLNNAMSMPKFILRYKFGKANRAIRDFDTVVSRYNERLSQVSSDAIFSPSKNMKAPTLKDKAYIIDRIIAENKKLQHKTKKWSDKHLDTYILPHPLMGKMPVREIVMWTSHHVNHHLNTLKEKY
ncbi:DinB family protein [uncultured Lacinutrix sp.]|uniref:DinB family protein n=1 Tax=uncultured Lacinutrix sp. TaxID=574032 RepID=UPI0026035E27|nr:DinB family protein [uncultured Lacinutrix sp.]